MTAINVSKSHPPIIQVARFARNGLVPQASFYNLTSRTLNHTLRWRRKQVFSFAGRVTAIDEGSGSAEERWAFRCRTGYGAHSLVFMTLLARETPVEFGSSDPYVEWAVKIAGGATTTTDPIRYGLVGAAEDGPSSFYPAITEVPVVANTTYECMLTAYDRARPVSCVVYEQSLFPDTQVSLYVPQSYSVRQPIEDAARAALLANATDMLKRNAAQLWWWSKDVTAQSRTSSTHANIADAGTTVSSATRGSTMDLVGRNTMSRSVIPVTFAVKGNTAAGSAGKARLQTASGTLIAITNISTTNQWYTTTGTISASSQKFDLQIAGDGTNAVNVEAACLYVEE